MPSILEDLYENHQPQPSEEDILVIPSLLESCPLLHDFMRFEQWQGNPSEPPTVRFYVSRGKLHVAISDTQRGRSYRAECADIEPGFMHLESVISSGEIQNHWFYWDDSKKPKKQKKDASSNGPTGASKASPSKRSPKRTAKAK